MRALQTTLAGLTMLALTLSAQAQKDKKKPPAKGQAAPVVDAEKALKPGTISGKAMAVTETSIQLRVEYQHLELKNPGGAGGKGGGGNQQAQLIRQQQQIAQAQMRVRMAKNPREAYQAMQQLQGMVQRAQMEAMRGQGGKGGAANSPYKVVTDSKEFNVELSGKVEFRVNNPSFLAGMTFDDMGNPKKFTNEELKELKGAANLPGYKATAVDVKTGATVTITLALDKEAENKLRGTRVLVTEQGTDTLPARKGKKK